MNLELNDADESLLTTLLMMLFKDVVRKGVEELVNMHS